MMARSAWHRRRRQRGGAAVEAAAIVPILALLMACPFLLGRVFWHYAAVQKAAHDAARYLATVPIAEMSNQARGLRAASLARDIAVMETGELYGGRGSTVSVTILCDDGICDFGVPTTVSALVRVRMYDPFFGGLTWSIVGDGGLMLRGKVVMRYVGQ